MYFVYILLLEIKGDNCVFIFVIALWIINKESKSYCYEKCLRLIYYLNNWYTLYMETNLDECMQ